MQCAPDCDGTRCLRNISGLIDKALFCEYTCIKVWIREPLRQELDLTAKFPIQTFRISDVKVRTANHWIYWVRPPGSREAEKTHLVHTGLLNQTDRFFNSHLCRISSVECASSPSMIFAGFAALLLYSDTNSQNSFFQ